MARERCTPFDRNRSGLLAAEGGSALVLETLEHAHRRGARVYAEVLGYGSNCDARHIVAPDADSIAACMRLAHANSGVTAGDIDYICAHGTGTPSNDLAEVRAIQQVFGPRLPPISSIKSMIGHAMGAASGFGAIASALAIHCGFIPPTIHWENPDPELGNLEPVPGVARESRIRTVQNNGLGFGGTNAVVVLGAMV
jgi:3-oxoacyl-[acyl-carrier-protein] synthase II